MFALCQKAQGGEKRGPGAGDRIPRSGLEPGASQFLQVLSCLKAILAVLFPSKLEVGVTLAVLSLFCCFVSSSLP